MLKWLRKKKRSNRIEEKKEVLKVLKKDSCVIALGGGAFINKTIRKNVLQDTISIWLDVDIKILNTRSKYNQNRPLLIKTNNQKIKEIYEKRKTIYKLAHHKIICDKLDKKEIVKKIIELYELQ